MSTTHLSLNLRTQKQVAWAASIALAGGLAFALLIVVLHVVRPDLNPIVYPTSRYAVGPYAFLMNGAFFSMSLGSFALVYALFHSVDQPVRWRWGLTLFGLWAVGVLVAMIFPMDVEGVPTTLAGTIHGVTGPVAFLFMCTGAFVISRRFQHDELWRPLYRTTLLLSLLLIAGYVATFLSFVVQLEFLGLVQRITLATLVVWMALVASHMLTRR